MTQTTGPRHTTASQSTATVAMVRGVRAWKQATRAVNRVLTSLRESVRATGWFVLGSAVIGLAVGFVCGWAEAVTAGLIALILVVFAIPYLFGSRAYRVSLSLERPRIVVGNEAGGVLTVQNVTRRPALPGVIHLPIGDGAMVLDVPLLRGGAVHELPIVIPGHRRGIMVLGPARTVRQDPLGMFRRERVWQDAQTLYVHPRTVQLPSMSSGVIRDLEGQTSSTIVPDDLSFHAIREYQPGDSRRQVHWKSTAKTGMLMVRQYEETRRSALSIVLASREDEFRDAEEFELAVSVAASIALRGIRDGREVQCSISEEIPEFARERYPHVSTFTARTRNGLLDNLAGVNSLSRQHTLAETARITAGQLTGASITFLVSGSSLTVDDIRRASLVFPANVTVVTVLCDRHAEPRIWAMGNSPVVSVAILEDLPHLVVRGFSG